MIDPATATGDDPTTSVSSVGYLLRQATETATESSRLRLQALIDELAERANEALNTQVRLRTLLSSVLLISQDLTLSAMLERLVGSACELVDARCGAIRVRATGSETSAALVANGISVAESEMLISDPPAGVLSVPIRTRNQLFGDLYLVGKEEGAAFTDEDHLLTIALASAAGVAIQNAQLFESQQRRGRWLAAASEIRSAALSGVDQSTLERLLVLQAQDAADAIFVSLARPRQGRRMVITASTEPAVLNDEFPSESSVSGKIARERGLVVLDNIDSGHRLASVPAEVRARSGRCVVSALGADSAAESLGVLLVAYPRDAAARADADLAHLAGFAAQSGIALKLASNQRDLERVAVLEDRERIARDLHDLVLQRMFAAGMTLQSIHAAVEDDTARARLTAVTDDLDNTIRELRNAVHELHPPPLADGLAVEIQALIDRVTRGTTINAFLTTADIGDRLPHATRAHVLAVVGEALSNVVRHADAANVEIAIRSHDGLLVVTVEDDGSGIAPEVTRRSGLANLATRAIELGGEVTIEHGPTAGTLITWTVPA